MKVTDSVRIKDKRETGKCWPSTKRKKERWQRWDVKHKIRAVKVEQVKLGYGEIAL